MKAAEKYINDNTSRCFSNWEHHPQMTWDAMINIMEGFAIQQASNETLPTRKETKALDLHSVIASTFLFKIDGINRAINESNYTAACVKAEKLYPGQTWEYVCTIKSTE